MVNSGKYRILPEIVFSKSNTKGRDKEYILCNSVLLTECLHILYGELTGLTVIHLCGWSCSALVRIEVDASARIFKNGFIVVLCILISITCQSIPVIKGQIIGSILFHFQLFSAVSPVNVVQDNAKGGTVCNNMMNVKEQIISITGSVNLKAEKLFIKQHVRTNQSFPVHSIYNLRLISESIITFLKDFSFVAHKETGFQVRMSCNGAVNCFCQLIQVNLFVKLQKIWNVVNGGSHIGCTLDENSLLGIGERIIFLDFPLGFFSGSLHKAL